MLFKIKIVKIYDMFLATVPLIARDLVTNYPEFVNVAALLQHNFFSYLQRDQVFNR